MKVFTDEVLAEEIPKYNILDENGNVVLANCQINLATEVTTAGTPQNRATWHQMQERKYTAMNNQRTSFPKHTDGYIPTTGWSNTNNAQTVNGVTISADSVPSSSGTANLVFDGDDSTSYGIPADSSIGNSKNIYFSFNQGIKITKLNIKATGTYSSSTYAYTWKIYGSKDNSNWTQLYSSSERYSSLTTITLSNTDFYKYYKINFSRDNYRANFMFYTVQTAEYYTEADVFNSGNSFATNEIPLLAYNTNQVIEVILNAYTNSGITTDHYVDPTINVMGLGNKTIQGNIEAGKRCLILYDGTKYIPLQQL